MLLVSLVVRVLVWGERERSWRVQEQEPLVPPVQPVPGVLPLNSRCNVQTSGWL